MAGRRSCRERNGCTNAVRAEGVIAQENREQEAMRMCRHVNPLPGAQSGSLDRRLCELQQLMYQQNRMLAELLQAMQGRNG